MKSFLARFILAVRGAIVLIVPLLAILLSACDWQSFGFNAAQTRFNNESDPPSALTPQWTAVLAGRWNRARRRSTAWCTSATPTVRCTR